MRNGGTGTLAIGGMLSGVGGDVKVSVKSGCAESCFVGGQVVSCQCLGCPIHSIQRQGGGLVVDEGAKVFDPVRRGRELAPNQKQLQQKGKVAHSSSRGCGPCCYKDHSVFAISVFVSAHIYADICVCACCCPSATLCFLVFLLELFVCLCPFSLCPQHSEEQEE